MNKLVAPVLAFLAFALVFACSAAQKQAESELASNTAACAAKCAVSNAILGKSAEEMLPACAAKCGAELLTDPNTRKNVLAIFAGAQAGVSESKLDAGVDAQ